MLTQRRASGEDLNTNGSAGRVEVSAYSGFRLTMMVIRHKATQRAVHIDTPRIVCVLQTSKEWEWEHDVHALKCTNASPRALALTTSSNCPSNAMCSVSTALHGNMILLHYHFVGISTVLPAQLSNRSREDFPISSNVSHAERDLHHKRWRAADQSAA